MSEVLNVKSGLFWNSINSFGRLGLNFLATVFLSRILTPSDFGTYGILLIFITISELIADSGMGGYIVKHKEVDSLDYDTLFVYNLVVSVLLYAVLFISAPYIARFYEDESLILGTRLCGIVVIIQSISIISTARLLKELSFKILAIISIVSGAIGLVSALIWGYCIGGYFALILQSLVSVTLNTVGLMWFTKTIPHFRFNFSRFKKQFSFGINLMGSTILQSITNNLSNNIIAKLFNMNLAGIYVQSSKLQNIPTSLIQSILDKTFFPVFSKINSDLEEFNRQARQMSRMAYAIGFPLMSLIICLARPIILIVLGTQWIECIKTFQLLMFASYPLLIKIINRNFLKALGFTRDILFIDLFPFFILLILLSVSIFLRSYYILVLSLVICNITSAVFSIYYISKRCQQSIVTPINSILPFCPIIIIAFLSFFGGDKELFIIISFIGFFLYFIICFIIGLPEYVMIVQQMRNILRKL